jgi:hypothetical protein
VDFRRIAVKKLLFIVVGVFSLFSVSSMDGPCRQELDAYVSSYNSHRDFAPIDSDIFKKAILEEIGEDKLAREEYALFHEDKYPNILDHWLQNHSTMTLENAERFKELLILITGVIAIEDGFVRWEDWDNSWKEKILRVVGDRSAVTENTFHHLPFCYKLAFSRLVDIGMGNNTWAVCQICDSMAYYLKDKQYISTDNVVGHGEWDDYVYLPDIWPELKDNCAKN